MKKNKFFSNVFMVAIIIWLLLPLVATFIYSLFRNWTEIVPKGFTLASYRSEEHTSELQSLAYL